jgi:tRNA threonylcarbamoyladenosine biosynthesis protein TsaE
VIYKVMDKTVIESLCEADTARLGRVLAQVLQPGTVVALKGDLGAGKTRLVQAIAESLGVDRQEVVSPTFVLLQEYQGEKAIYHVDAYRISNNDEFMQLGMEEYFTAGGLVFIEWADRVADCLPPNTVWIEIEVTGDTTRRFTITGLPSIVTLGNLE